VKQIWFERGGALVLAILACYVWLATHHPVDGESAEFATLSVTGGAAHPPGYPLYVLWLRALSWLPGTSPAHTAALATVLLAVAGFVCLHAACRAWGARPLAATLTVAMFAAAPVVLRVETEPEVFALNNLFAALILWLAAKTGPLRGSRRTLALGLVAGLGLANHTTIVLMVPIGLVGAVRGIRESEHRVGATALGIAGLAVGLAPYAYLLVASDTPMSWGRARGLADVLAFFTRRDYGGAGAFAPYAGDVDVASNLGALAQTLGRGWLWLPLPVAVLGVARRGTRDRIGWVALGASWVVAGPLLAARFNIAPEGVGLLVCQRFHLLPLLLLAPAVAVGIDWLHGVVARRGQGALESPLLGGALAVLLFATLVIADLPRQRAIASPAIEKSVASTLRTLPPRAVVITQTDDVHSGAIYVQTALGIRPDVTVITAAMLTFDWYRARLIRAGLPADASPLKLAEHVHATGRPLFVDLSQVAVIAAYPTYPHGWLFRVLPRGARPPTLDEIVAENREVTAHLDLDYSRPGPDDGYPTAIHKRYAQPWKIIARALRDAGRLDDARAALDLARQLAPQESP
jgi:hypothetical protein